MDEQGCAILPRVNVNNGMTIGTYAAFGGFLLGWRPSPAFGTGIWIRWNLCFLLWILADKSASKGVKVCEGRRENPFTTSATILSKPSCYGPC